jgi:hypothetical protein
MIRNPARPDAAIPGPDGEPDAVRAVACPMCHSPAPLTPSALDTGGAWRCGRCGQHWDAARLTAVAAYAAWVADRDRMESRSDTP